MNWMNLFCYNSLIYGIDIMKLIIKINLMQKLNRLLMKLYKKN